MRVKYQLEDGMFKEFYLNKWFKYLEDPEDINDEGILKAYPFAEQLDDPTIKYKGYTIHVNNFLYNTVDELIEIVKAYQADNNCGAHLYSDDIVKTLLRDFNNFGLVIETACFDFVIPEWGLGIKSYSNFDKDNKFFKALYIPFEDRYKKSDWNYKIDFRPLSDDLYKACGKETYYTSDLASLILSGRIQLINKTKFLEQEEKKSSDSKLIVSKENIKINRAKYHIIEE